MSDGADWASPLLGQGGLAEHLEGSDRTARPPDEALQLRAGILDNAFTVKSNLHLIALKALSYPFQLISLKCAER